MKRSPPTYIKFNVSLKRSIHKTGTSLNSNHHKNHFYQIALCLAIIVCSTSKSIFIQAFLAQSTMKAINLMQRRIHSGCSRINTRTFQLNPIDMIPRKNDLHSNKSNNGILQQMLAELTVLNQGKSINPRSPKQVSELLYPHNGQNGSSGSTDKNTLLSIIRSPSDSMHTDKQKRIALLILRCREMMSSCGSIDSSFGVTNAVRRASFSSSASSNSSTEADDTIKKDREGQNTLNTTNVVQPPNVDSYLDKTSVDPFLRPQSGFEPSMSPYDLIVRNLFSLSESQISLLDPYWIEPLLSLTKPSAKALVRQLHPHCPLAFDPKAEPNNLRPFSATTIVHKKETPLLSFVRKQKRDHFSDAILLIRVGDFYETYGIDAIMLVEFAGLNPMAGRAKAGCPWRNVQATLDALTGAGFRVAVYEESNEGQNGELSFEDKDGGSSKNKLKIRYLSQVVSSANPTYMYGLVLNDDESALDDSSASIDRSQDEGSFSGMGRCFVGVLETNAGYTMVEISAEERTAVVSERLTSEALSCRLVAYPPADPLFYVPPSDELARRTDRLPFLPWTQQQKNQQISKSLSPVSRVRVKTIPPSLVVGPTHGLSEIQRAKQTIVDAFLRLEDDSIMAPTSNDELDASLSPKRRKHKQVTHQDFVLITSNSDGSLANSSTAPFPLHLETATQLGLMGDKSIPSIVASLLPETAPSSSKRFLRRWLLVRPPPDVADSMSTLIQALKEEDHVLPNSIPLTAKVIPMIRAGQASASIYRNILCALDAAIKLLEQNNDISRTDIIPPLLRILNHDTGIDVVHSTSLKTSFISTKQAIEEVVSTYDIDNTNNEDGHQERISYFGDVIPYPFFERNEFTWRGRVNKSALQYAHSRVASTASQLAEAVAKDFWGVDCIHYNNECELDLSSSKISKTAIIHDILNNMVAIRKQPDWAKNSECESRKYYHPRDRNGKIMTTRYTTERVEAAISDYLNACLDAKEEVTNALMELSFYIADNKLTTILQASHLNLITSTAANHAASSNAKGWNVGAIHDRTNNSSAGVLNGLWPYWMDKMNSIPNTFNLDGMFLLTAPNMSGKSTIMRSTAAAALLISSGLCAPIEKGSSISRFDSLFVRGASADIPTENKSAFGAEMGDISSLFRTCGNRSLVFVDEIGRGTSPKDGTCLAGAILERMADVGMSGMFATHLHGLLSFPLSDSAVKKIRKKRMEIAKDESGQFKWTYKLEDGVCTNSMALLTASKFGLPNVILDRAKELAYFWDSHNDSTISSINTIDIDTARKKSRQLLEKVAGDTETIHIAPNYMQQNTATVTVTPKTKLMMLLEEVAEDDSVYIPPNYDVPPSLEGRSCLYILQMGEAPDKSKYYVGETDSLARRLSQHRSKGSEWSSASALAVPVKGGKSTARSLESLTIQRMSKLGYQMASIADGTFLRPGKR